MGRSITHALVLDHGPAGRNEATAIVSGSTTIRVGVSAAWVKRGTVPGRWTYIPKTGPRRRYRQPRQHQNPNCIRVLDRSK